jgi:hypothetical protein
MALTIKETYDLGEEPKVWGDVIQQAVKHFFAANGVMPNCLTVHELLMERFPGLLKALGFTVFTAGLKEEHKEKLMEKGEMVEMLDIPFTLVVSPEGDYKLLVSETDKVDLLQFQLAHIDGRKKKVN